MDKFEYGDLYKFSVSVGIILIALAFLLPWFYLKEPFDLLIEKSKILQLTIQAQHIISGRQKLIENLYSIIPTASIILLISGIICIVWGLFKWFKKQADIDKRDLLTTKKLEQEVNNMTATEVVNKNEQEFEEVANVSSDTEQSIPTPTNIITNKEDFISSYVQIEQFFINKLTSIYQKKYKILANVIIKDDSYDIKAEYDLILNSWSQLNSDYIFEFKYYPNGVTKSTVRDNVIKLDWKSKIYAGAVKQNIKSILLIVLPEERYNKERFIELRKLPEEINLINKKVVVDFINIKNLDIIGNDYFDNLINS